MVDMGKYPKSFHINYNHFIATWNVRDNPGESVPEGTFWHLLDFLM